MAKKKEQEMQKSLEQTLYDTAELQRGKIVDNEDYHRKWHPNVHSVNQFDKYEM